MPVSSTESLSSLSSCQHPSHSHLPPGAVAPSTSSIGPTRTRGKSNDLSRDTRLQILTLHNIAKWNMLKIAKVLGVTYEQVRTAVKAGHPTPQKRIGRTRLISEEQIDEIELFVCQSKKNRRMPYKALVKGMYV